MVVIGFYGKFVSIYARNHFVNVHVVVNRMTCSVMVMMCSLGILFLCGIVTGKQIGRAHV